MSAHLVSKTHIDALLTAGLRLPTPGSRLRWYLPGRNPGAYQELTRENAGMVGAMLLAENQRSVNFRYREDEIEFPYEFTLLPGQPDPVDVLKAISGYEYQTCEHTEWPHSEAYEFCDNLRRAAIRRLPGYDQSPCWSIDDPRVFTA